jgi:hypothetical protein
MTLRNVARHILALGAVAGLSLASGSAFAGAECEGGGLTNNIFPGPTSPRWDVGVVDMQIVDMSAAQGWTAYGNATMYYAGSNGTSVSGQVSVAFSDRLAPNSTQRFYSQADDSWLVTVTQTGTITIQNNTWGGTTTWNGTCAGMNGVLYATSGNDHFLVSFGRPGLQYVPT